MALLACVADGLVVWQTPYIWKRRADGLYVINLAKTWEKLMLAARVIVAIENPQDGEDFVMCLPLSGPCWHQDGMRLGQVAWISGGTRWTAAGGHRWMTGL